MTVVFFPNGSSKVCQRKVGPIQSHRKVLEATINQCLKDFMLVPTVIGHVGWNTTGIFCSGAKIRVRGGVSGHVEVDGYEATVLLQVALSDLNSIWIEWRDVSPASNGRSDGVRRAHCQTV